MNKNIASTVITDKIRISSAAIFYEEWFGTYYQYETWIFSNDETVKSNMKIHGTSSYVDNKLLTQKATDLHNRLARILNRKFNQKNQQ